MTLTSPVSSTFVCSRAFDPTKNHYGIDARVIEGTTITASGAGKIVRASDHADFGNVVIIDHGKDEGFHVYTLYAHLKSFAEGIRVGELVDAGAAIGLSGNTGRSTGAHLHFEELRSAAPLAIPSAGGLGFAGSAHRVDPALHTSGLPVSCG